MPESRESQPPVPDEAHDPADPSAAPARAERPGAAAERSTVRSLLRLWPYVRPVRVRLFTAACVAIVASCLGLVIPLVLKWLVDGPVAGRDPGGVWLGGAFLLFLGIAEASLFGLRRWLVARPLAGVEAAMRADLYHHLQRLPVSFHDRWASGQLLSRATTDLQLLRMFLAFPLTFLLVNSTTILVGFAVLLVQEWTLGMVLLAPVVPLLVLCSWFEARYSVAARRAQDQLGDLTTVVEESVLGIRIIKGFGRHRSQARAYRVLSERVRGTELHKARLLAAIWAFILTIPEIAVAAALVLGTVQVADGGLSAGTLVAFLSTALALRWPVESIGFLLAMSQESATATERYFEVMDAPPQTDAPEAAACTGCAEPERTDAGHAEAERTEAGGAKPGRTEAGGAKPGRTEAGGAKPGRTHTRVPGPERTDTPGPEPDRISVTAPGAAGTDGADADGLRFVQVEFRYPDAPAESSATLRGVDLHIRTGETMALVGATGSGKTTLTALVPRLHNATGGRITLDGADVATMPRARLRELVAVAFEEPTLFSATAGENVLMGADGVGQDALLRALEVSQAEFVHALPQGADTQVGEQGLSLSGGQRQRLALARAVVGSPRFLVLDDPLSALDVHTEALVEAALRQVLATTTALVVAHRPSTVMLADRVALLSEGRIAAVGTHHELLRASAEYRSLMSGETGEGDGQEPGSGLVTASQDPPDAHRPPGLAAAGTPDPTTTDGGASR
ncbi:ABC transporter ATP-binding protein [Streptomyces sp. NPDC047108]|uniref:ABC transporter ATP-binding protein n=1 Tax=Streptomyces sp. NPDC047108 TaxID=3155025 RepID=UPI0033F0E725